MPKKNSDSPIKELSSGRMFDLFRNAGLLCPGLSFITADTDAAIVNNAKRKGVKVSTHRLYSIDVRHEAIVKFVRVTVLEVYPLTTNN